MYNHLKLILSTFTRQRQPNDCGIACLNSVFKYAGLKSITAEQDISRQYSLLQLDKIAKNAGLVSSCVKMDVIALNNASSPCILYILNEAGRPHFVVHYPCRMNQGFHLVGDPDRKLEMISEEELLNKWVSRAALYFEDVKPDNAFSIRLFPWNAFIGFKFIPAVLWLSIPFLNLLAALLGLALSLVIQKAVEPAFINNRQSFFVLLFVLLGLIALAKCLLNYLRQRLMITIGLKIDAKLYSAFYQNTYRSFRSSDKHANHFYLSSAGDVQKIHQAVALLTGVALSDGILVMMMFGVLFFYQPALVILQIAVFIAMLIVIDKFLPIMLIHFNAVQPAIGPANNRLWDGREQSQEGECIDFERGYFKLNENLSMKTRDMSRLANKINLSFDAISNISLVVVVIRSVCKLQANQITYEGFLMSILLCYGIGMLMSKICNQLFTIAQGADRLRRNLQETE